MLERGFDRAGSAHGATDSCHSFWRHIHESFLGDLQVLHGWVDAETCPQGQDLLHDIATASLGHLRVVVAKRNARDAREYVQELIAVDIRDVVANRLLQVNWEVLLFVA